MRLGEDRGPPWETPGRGAVSTCCAPRFHSAVRVEIAMMSSWQVATAAETLAAAQFAHCGWDVSVQHAENHPASQGLPVCGSENSFRVVD